MSAQQLPESRDSTSSLPKEGGGIRPQGFAWSAFWSVVGNVSLRASQAAILIALTKLGGKATVGAYAIALAACNPLMLFSYLQLGSVLAADSTGRYPFACYWRLRVLLCGAAAVAVIGLAFLFGASASQLSVISVLAVAKVFEGMSDIRHGLLKRADRMDLLAVAQCVRSLVTLVSFLATFAVTGDLFWSVLVLGCGWALCLVLIDLPLSRKVMLPQDFVAAGRLASDTSRKQWVPLAVASVPLGLISLVISVYAYFPQYLLEAGWGEAELGLFVAVASLPIVLETVARSVAQATIPRFAGYCASGDLIGFRQLYRRSLALFAGLGASGILLAWLFGELVLSWLFNAELAEYHSLLLLMTVAAASSFLCSYASIFVAMKQYVAFLKLWCIGLLSLGVFGALLVPGYGVYGAGWAILAGNLIRIALVHHSIYKLLGTSFTQVPRIPKSSRLGAKQAA